MENVIQSSVATSGQAHQTRRLEEDDLLPGITVEPNDSRVHVWIKPRFSVRHGMKTFEGEALSIEGFKIAGGVKAIGPADVLGGDQFFLQIQLDGFSLDLKVTAERANDNGDDDGNSVTFLFKDLERNQREVLRRTLRAFMAGNVANADDLLHGADQPTPIPRKADEESGAGLGFLERYRYRDLAIGGVALLFLLTVLGLAGIGMVERTVIVRSEFATVTAPSIAFRAPASGQIRFANEVGDVVERGNVIVGIETTELEAQLIEARVEARSLAFSDDRSAFQLAQGRLKALELREAGNSIHSPCNCKVVWTLAKGDWVRPGDLVATVADTNTDALKVEALVPIREAVRLKAGSRATIVGADGKPLSATVESVALNGAWQPRVGLPDSLKQEQNMIAVSLVPETPVRADMLGVPMTVYFSRWLPLIGRV